MEKGGHIFAITDFKALDLFKVPLIHDGKRWRVDTSLAVVIKGQIKFIAFASGIHFMQVTFCYLIA